MAYIPPVTINAIFATYYVWWIVHHSVAFGLSAIENLPKLFQTYKKRFYYSSILLHFLYFAVASFERKNHTHKLTIIFFLSIPF